LVGGKVERRDYVTSAELPRQDISWSRRRTFICIAAACAAFMRPGVASGDTWDNDSGDALWANTFNWDSNFALPTAADTAVFNSPFANGDNIITLPSNATCISLTLNDSYTLTGGALDINGSGSVSVAAAEIATISSNLSGNNGLTKAGAGTLVLSGTKSFTGTVNVNAGTLQVSTNGNFGNSANAIVIAGGTLAVTSGITTTRTFSLGTGGGTISVPNNVNFAVDTALAASANSLTLTGPGTLELGAGSARTGSTFINNGIVLVRHGSALGSGAIVASGGGLMLTDVTVNQALTFNNDSTLYTAGASTYAGTITVGAGGTVHLGMGTAIGGSDMVIGNAANDLTGGSSANIVVDGGPLGLENDVHLGFANNYVGAWTINTDANVRITHGSALGTGTSTINVNGGLLHVGGVTLDRAMTLTAGSELLGTGTSSSLGTTTIAAGALVSIATGSAGDTFTIGNAASHRRQRHWAHCGRGRRHHRASALEQFQRHLDHR
jgi:fibronectin-binding autotransporter adhesin